MTSRAAGSVAAPHLATLARAPRPAGSAPEREARDYAAGVLAGAGFAVTREPFEYSALPGRYGTPIGGAILLAGIAASACWALCGDAHMALVSLVAGVAATALFARAMLGDAVLDLRRLRARSENLVATRGGEPSVWLVAHLDSKSQPVPSALRVAGVALMLASLALAVACVVAQLAGASSQHVRTSLQLAGGLMRTGWWLALAMACAGGPPVIASVVGDRSDGAVDNASGVSAVLAAASLLPARANVGVLLTSAEELGLAGARAFARTHARAVCINCDGVDDDGVVTIMHSGARPVALVEALAAASGAPARVRRMPLGLLTDSVAFSRRGWPAATVSRGSWKTLRRVHTSRDSLDHLRGEGIGPVATMLARAAEALA